MRRLLDAVEHAAFAACVEILEVYASDFAVTEKSDASPLTQADSRAEAVILKYLTEVAPEIPVIAEEQVVFPPEARQRYEQGRDLQKKGQLNEALNAFEDAIKLGMDAFPRVHLQQAGSNLDLKKYDTAIARGREHRSFNRGGVHDSL